MKRPERSMAYIGRYSLLSMSGRDARGRRYHAYDMEHQREVSLLVLDLPAGTRVPDEVLSALQRWLVTMRLLSHPNIARVYSFEVIDGLVLITYEYLPGRSLAEVFIEPGMALDFGSVMRVGEQVAAALDYLHEHHVVHQCLEPHNVIVQPDGRVVLVDAGLDRFIPLPLGSEESGESGWAYRAPELRMGQPASAASDIYSLGALLYRMVTGGELSAATRKRIGWEEYTPHPLMHAISRAVAADPTQRYSSPGALIAALTHVREAPDRLTISQAWRTLVRPRLSGRLAVSGLAVMLFGMVVWIGWSALLPADRSVAALSSATNVSPGMPSALPTLTPAASHVGPRNSTGTGPRNSTGTGPQNGTGTGPRDSTGTGPRDSTGTGRAGTSPARTQSSTATTLAPPVTATPSARPPTETLPVPTETPTPFTPTPSGTDTPDATRRPLQATSTATPTIETEGFFTPTPGAGAFGPPGEAPTVAIGGL